MLKKILYIISSIIVILLITFFVMNNQINKRMSELQYELLAEANEGNFDNFIRYQTLYYQKQETLTLPDYDVDIYLTIDKLNPFISKILIVVIPNKDVGHAVKKDDLNDNTKAIVVNNGVTHNSKDLKYQGEFPISYGLTKNNFYYYSFPIKSGNTQINLYNYEGDKILEESIDLDIKTSGEDLENEYIKGFTSKETTNLMMRKKGYLTLVYVTFGVLTGLAILIGYFYFRKINLEK